MIDPEISGKYTIHIGDVFAEMGKMGSDSVDCVVTSPPYWGLRDYGIEGQIGLESTLGEHLEVMVRVFEGVKRILKPSGTLWINYGDCYATTPNGRSAADTKAAGNDDRTFRDKPFSTVGPIQARSNGGEGQHHDRRGGILKPKDLCMVPNRVAIALQEAGWWVRSEIVWGKRNPMPESVIDRPAVAHEKIFMLTKSARYWYDAEAVRVDSAGAAHRNGFRGENDGPSAYVNQPNVQSNSKKKDKKRGVDVASPRHAGHANHTGIEEAERGSRNLRNYEPAPLEIWDMAIHSFSEAHFATFPPELAKRAILAGCPKGGLVLDPFGGTGTTAMVALRYQRLATLIEINPEYAEIARIRIESEWGGPKRNGPPVVLSGGLFDLINKEE